MKYNNATSALLVALMMAGCGGGGGGDNNNNNTPPSVGTENELTVTVNGALADPNTSSGYFNKPAVAVKICQPGTNNCQTITDILLDTGSYGLRIFNSAISVPLTQATVGSRQLGECIFFADGSSSWGPVKYADVVLAGEPAVQIPIHVLDTSFGASSVCGTPDAGPQEAGFHGILGVGIFAQDCGPACAGTVVGQYFACSGTNCIGTTVPVGNQVQNPVAALPQDNNGILVQLPGVPPTGAKSVDGKVIFGIATRSNNIPTPGGVTTFDVSTAGNFPSFVTTLNGTNYNSFLDTGSNGIFIPASANLLPVCTSNSAWFCPPSTTGISVTNKSASGNVSAPFSFQIANFQTLLTTGNQVFNDLGGPSSGSEIDYGLPFFLGRDVFIGYEGRSSTLGNGPYWSF